MKKRVLILEDLASSRKSLVEMVSECGQELLIYDFGDPAKAYECAMENRIDLFLVDIILRPKDANDFSGITFAKSIRECSRYAASEIVFITTLAGLEAEMLRLVHCFDYIEKPISRQRVHRVVKDALQKIESKDLQEELIFLRKDRITYPVYADRIIYAENRRRVLYVHTKDEVIDIPNLSLKKFVEKVYTQRFLCPTRGVVVNVNYIEYIDTTNRYVKMKGVETLLDIGAHMKENFLEELRRYEGVDAK